MSSTTVKYTIIVPEDIMIVLNDKTILLKKNDFELEQIIPKSINIKQYGNKVVVTKTNGFSINRALMGTVCALINNMLIGLEKGFSKILQLVGIGYRVMVQDNIVILYIGFSHVINYSLPKGIVAECPNNTEIILRGINKQLVGQVAADLRAFRPPEPFKGKGIRYIDELVYRKEIKKK